MRDHPKFGFQTKQEPLYLISFWDVIQLLECNQVHIHRFTFIHGGVWKRGSQRFISETFDVNADDVDAKVKGFL